MPQKPNSPFPAATAKEADWVEALQQGGNSQADALARPLNDRKSLNQYAARAIESILQIIPEI